MTHTLLVRTASLREHRISLDSGKKYDIVAASVRVVRVDELLVWAADNCPGLVNALRDAPTDARDVHP